MLNMVLRIFLRVIAQRLQSNSPGAAQVDRAALHIGALAFIHRFGSSLNGHVHFHVCKVRLPDPRRVSPLILGIGLALLGAASAAKMSPCSANHRGLGRSHRVSRIVLVPTRFRPDHEV